MNRRNLIKSIIGGLAILSTKTATASIGRPNPEYIPIWRLDNGVYVRVRMRDLKVNDIIKVMFETTGIPVVSSYRVIASPSRTDDLPSGSENWIVELEKI